MPKRFTHMQIDGKPPQGTPRCAVPARCSPPCRSRSAGGWRPACVVRWRGSFRKSHLLEQLLEAEFGAQSSSSAGFARATLAVRVHRCGLRCTSSFASAAAISSKEGARQSCTCSAELVARHEPSEENRATSATLLNRASVRISCMVSIFQSLTRLSPQLASVLPSGENARPGDSLQGLELLPAVQTQNMDKIASSGGQPT